MGKANIEKLVEDTLNSLDGSARAEPRPYLLTRVLARMRARDEASNFWTRAGTILSKPAVAFGGVLLILGINAAIIVSNINSTNNAARIQNSFSAKDEFAINGTSIYDLENQEP